MIHISGTQPFYELVGSKVPEPTGEAAPVF